MDNLLFLVLIPGALVVAAGIFAIAVAWRRAMRADAPPPFFGKLERQGLTLKQAEEVVGIEGLSAAVRRCVFCGEQHACRTELALGSLASPPVDCPNAKLFGRVKGTPGGPDAPAQASDFTNASRSAGRSPAL